MADANASGIEPEQQRELEAAIGVSAERERQRVAEHERHRAERRAPDDPAQLPARGHRADRRSARTMIASPPTRLTAR